MGGWGDWGTYFGQIGKGEDAFFRYFYVPLKRQEDHQCYC